MDTCNALHTFQRIMLKGKNSVSNDCILCDTNYIIFFFFKFMYLFLAVLGLRSCSGFFLVAESRGYSSVVVHSLLTAAASLVVDHGLQSLQALVAAAPRLQSTGSVLAVHGLSSLVAHGIFLDQGSNLCPLHWQADSLPLCHQGSPT